MRIDSSSLYCCWRESLVSLKPAVLLVTSQHQVCISPVIHRTINNHLGTRTTPVHGASDSVTSLLIPPCSDTHSHFLIGSCWSPSLISSGEHSRDIRELRKGVFHYDASSTITMLMPSSLKSSLNKANSIAVITSS